MSLLKRIFAKKIQEAELNKMSCEAGAYYVNQKLQGAPMTEQQRGANYVAHGYFMGMRKYEELLGVKGKK